MGAYKAFIEKDDVLNEQKTDEPKFVTASYNGAGIPNPLADVDFTNAAEKTVHSVVNISKYGRPPVSIFSMMRGDYSQDPVKMGMGSGVIISPDGYIITNNHVIQNSTQLQVTLNDNRTYDAELVGTDPSTDIALLKIDAKEKLSYLAFGDSDNTKIGEWVLAVGNPFNLTSTVTAGIISAKSRSLGNNQSFIQTDAAVNPGNSGGALVDTNGNLIGINTAITSQTGSYIGYSFAVPSNIAKKVVEDLLEYGNVQEGILGVQGEELNAEKAENLGLNQTTGFYIGKIVEGSGAEQAGLKKGDIIKKIENQNINNYAQLTGFLKSKRPNDVVSVTVLREGETKTIPVTLLKNEMYLAKSLGFVVKNMSDKDKRKFKAKGVKISQVAESWSGYGFEGKVITHINDEEVENIDDVKNILGNLDGYRAKITIVNDEGEKESFFFRL